MQSIRPIDFQMYFNNKSSEMAHETLWMQKTCLYRLFESAVINDIIPKNPVYNIVIKSAVPPAEKCAYIQEQFDTVLGFCRTHKFGAPIATMLLCGVSRSELLGIWWEDVDVENCIIHIRQDVTEQKDPDYQKNWTDRRRTEK